MLLPHGLMTADGTVHRSYTFKPVDGRLEAAVAEHSRWPDRATVTVKILAAALDRVGDMTVDETVARSLAVGDARYLMAQLARHFEQDIKWLTAKCTACGTPFDFQISLGDLPLTSGTGAGTLVDTQLGPLAIKVPNCGELIAAGQAADPLAHLLRAAIADDQVDVAELSDDDLQAIDTALSALSPTVIPGIAAPCPGCRHENAIAIATSDWIESLGDGPLEDVHAIASAYGWSEQDILALPRNRRASYIHMIEQARGVVGERYT